MDINGYFFSPPEISIPPLSRDGHYPSWWDTVLTNRGPLVHSQWKQKHSVDIKGGGGRGYMMRSPQKED